MRRTKIAAAAIVSVVRCLGPHRPWRKPTSSDPAPALEEGFRSAIPRARRQTFLRRPLPAESHLGHVGQLPDRPAAGHRPAEYGPAEAAYTTPHRPKVGFARVKPGEVLFNGRNDPLLLCARWNVCLLYTSPSPRD